eukprot:8964623-Ditylum_brightwellii.AAC.1
MKKVLMKCNSMTFWNVKNKLLPKNAFIWIKMRTNIYCQSDDLLNCNSEGKQFQTIISLMKSAQVPTEHFMREDSSVEF